MKLEITQQLRQQQILAPQMILSMDILLLSNLELENRIQEEFTTNPALELEEMGSPPDPGQSPPQAPDEPERNIDKAEAEIFAQLASFQNLPSMSSLHERTRAAKKYSSEDHFDALANTAGKPTGLREHLIEQIHLMSPSAKISEIAEFIVNNLDPRGYLLSPCQEIHKSSKCSEQEFLEAWDLVRGLDPVGVGATDLRDCLILQLDRDLQDYPLETKIIQEYLAELRQNKLPKIARELGRSLEDIKDALEIISSLTPVPGDSFDHSPTLHIKPEVVVEKIEGKFDVKVNDQSLPTLKINESCRTLLKESKGNREVVKFVRKKLESAQWLIQAVHQRQRTLSDITKTILDHQRDFMEDGPTRLRALKMQTIADAMGIHISTVSRAIKGKYMQTPWGMFEIRYFFTGGVEGNNGELVSRRNILRDISAMIEAEDKKEPLSDSDIARILRGQGLDIARRTVTKYREQGGLPSSRLRKKY